VVDLPPDSEQWLDQTTAGLVTHCRFGHFDHLDRAGIRLLARKQVPVYCNGFDEPYLKRRHIKTVPLELNNKSKFLTGHITAFPTKHGHGLAGLLMRPGAGYFIELPGKKSIYISGDTVMTAAVRHVLTDLRPDISILNSGTATLDFGKPILMTLSEQLEFIRTAPGSVVAVHLDAFNHCLTTRDKLRVAVSKEGLSYKTIIPDDGDMMEF